MGRQREDRWIGPGRRWMHHRLHVPTSSRRKPYHCTWYLHLCVAGPRNSCWYLDQARPSRDGLRLQVRVSFVICPSLWHSRGSGLRILLTSTVRLGETSQVRKGVSGSHSSWAWAALVAEYAQSEAPAFQRTELDPNGGLRRILKLVRSQVGQTTSFYFYFKAMQCQEEITCSWFP